MQKIIGTVVHFSPEGKFGFLISRNNASSRIQKYFFHAARLVSCEVQPEKIKVGYYARFSPSPHPPKRSTDAPYATDVEIFINDPSTAGIEVLAGVSR